MARYKQAMTGGQPMTSLMQRIVSQRLRAARIAALAFSAGALLYLGKAGSIGPVPLPVFTGLLYALFITPAAVLTAAFLPALTSLSDAMQWSRLAFAGSVAAFPATLRPVADAPLASASVIIAIGTALVWARRHLRAGRPAPAPLAA